MIPFIFIRIYNGYVQGLSLTAYKIWGKSIFRTIFFCILPYGVFELPAVIYSFGDGLYV